MPKLDALQCHEQELYNNNRRSEHQLEGVRIEEQQQKDGDAESTEAVIDAKVNLFNAKMSSYALECQASTERSALLDALEDLDSVKGELGKTSSRLRVAKKALTATFDHPWRHSSNGQATGAAVQDHSKFILPKYIQKVFDQTKQSSEAY